MIASQAAGPSDPGMAAERTMLAWSRLGMTLLGVPSALFAYAATQSLVASVAAVVAAVLGLALLTLSLRRQRLAPGAIARGEAAPVATLQVLITAGCVLMLALSSLLLVGSAR